jgi:hypothetical protein
MSTLTHLLSSPAPLGTTVDVPSLDLISFRTLGPQDAPDIQEILDRLLRSRDLSLVPVLVRDGCTTVVLTLADEDAEAAEIALSNLVESETFRDIVGKAFDVAISHQPYRRLNLRTGSIEGLSDRTGVAAFISYAREDRSFKESLRKHLIGLVKKGLLRCFDDSDLAPGEGWKERIDEQLQKADLMLPLASANFNASVYCQAELDVGLRRRAAGTLDIMPILIKPFDLVPTPFADLQYLPRTGGAVSQQVNEEAAWTEIATAIRLYCAGKAGVGLPFRGPRSDG